MKQISQIRRDNLESLIRSMGKLEAVAAACDTSAVYLSQIRKASVDAKSGRPREMGTTLARKIEQALGKAPGWMDHDHSQPQAESTELSEHANSPHLSGYVNIHILDKNPVTRMVAWEALMRSDLPELFSVAVIDDSMAPDLKLGYIANFSRKIQPREGDWVLVRGTGGAAIREYLGLGEGRWVASPSNRQYRTLDSEQDQLEVVAVYVGCTTVGRRNGAPIPE